MTKRTNIFASLGLIFLSPLTGSAATVTINADNIFVINGKPAFPIGFTIGPPPGGKTPSGQDAYTELKKNGAVFQRCDGKLGAESDFELRLDASAKAGLLCAISIPDVQVVSDAKKEAELRRVVNKYKGHPGLGYWKGKDEPQWGKAPVSGVQKYYDIVHELDPNHPVWITQAPRGTLPQLKAYDPAYDVGAIDIYPVGYPPGMHSHLPNKNISVVGDYADWMRQITEGKKPFWMALQICWSGVVQPGKTLRFPTLPEERYMTYQSIIKGARGLVYFGGNVVKGLNERDAKLGWNWAFYYKVLEPVLAELRPDSPLYPALIAPDSKLPVRLEGEAGVEFTVREAGGRIFILAAKREGDTIQVKFRGLPGGISAGDVLFEEPRTVAVSGGSFTDWFGPNEVHVYRFAAEARRSAEGRGGIQKPE